MKINDALALSEEDYEEASNAEMEATARVYGIRVGDVVDQVTFDAIQLYDKMARDDDEGRLTVFHQGYQAGMQRAGGVDTAKLIEERDNARASASVANALRTSGESQAFRRGAQACREMLARFVEQGGDETTAVSIRANWHPEWGDDPGRPDELPTIPQISAKPASIDAVDTYRGWVIHQGRWPEPAWSATGPNYDASYEGEEDGWVGNGEKAEAPAREGLIAEIDAWFEERAPLPPAPQVLA